VKPGIDQLISRNVAAIADLRRRAEARRTRSQRVADSVFRVAGSTRFVVAHLVGFAIWILVNSSLFAKGGIWDPYPFVMLTTVVSLEAIILSSLVLASQNRAQRLADQNADLDLHVNLLAEHEVTRILQRVDAIADKLDVEKRPADTDALEQELAPSKILHALAQESKDDEHMLRPDSSEPTDDDAGKKPRAGLRPATLRRTPEPQR
jgi:uncharacterized membrane protein